VATHQLPHRRVALDAAEQIVLFRRQHGPVSWSVRTCSPGPPLAGGAIY
jgi:hypothetical protein